MNIVYKRIHVIHIYVCVSVCVCAHVCINVRTYLCVYLYAPKSVNMWMSDRQVNLGLVNGNRNEPKPILRLGGLTITCSALTRVTLAHAHEQALYSISYTHTHTHLRTLTQTITDDHRRTRRRMCMYLHNILDFMAIVMRAGDTALSRYKHKCSTHQKSR